MRILVAIDGSGPSEGAVREVASRPWPADSEMKIVMVEEPVDRGLISAGFQTAFDRMVENQRAEADGLVRQSVSLVQKENPSLQVHGSILQGWPRQSIVAEAERWRADLIVLGAHGRSALSRLLLGSVSDYVVQNAPCSVEVARPRPVPLTESGQHAEAGQGKQLK